MGGIYGARLVVLAAALAVAMMGMMAEGQQGQNDCAAKLVPCSAYLNSTTPPDSCCKPLKEAVRDERKCLCDLYSDTSFLKSLRINVTQALELPKHCGITDDLTACNTLAPGGSKTPTGNSSPSTPLGVLDYRLGQHLMN